MRRHPTRPDAFGWTGRLRETAEPLFFLPIRACRTYRSLRRTNQAPTDTTSQAREAPIKAAATLISTSIENRAAKASMPTEPSPAPTASSAAASCPRRLPASPAARLRRISCFSISVALAQKMAGRARKSPPTDAPDEAGEDGRDPAKPEADQVFVPAALPQRGRRKPHRRHVRPPAKVSRPNATISQTTRDNTVAGAARSPVRTSRWQTPPL